MIQIIFFSNYVNYESVFCCKLEKSYWENVLKELVDRHIRFTNSMIAKEIIANWEIEKNNFWQVVPNEVLETLEHPISSQDNKDLEKKMA